MIAILSLSRNTNRVARLMVANDNLQNITHYSSMSIFSLLLLPQLLVFGYWFGLMFSWIQLHCSSILNEHNATDTDVDLFIVEHNLYAIKLLDI